MDLQTTPAKALRINNGLGAISYSITGGALAAQGERTTIFLLRFQD